MTKVLRPFAFALAAAIALPFSTVAAQGEFNVGTKIISAGLLTGSAGGTGLGGAFEYSLLELAPKLRLGVGATLGYYSDSDFGIDVSSIPILANGNVHFALPEVPKLDLFAGLAVGFVRTSIDLLGESVSDNETVVGVNLGGRYFFTDKLAGVAQLGVGDIPEIFVGITFKL